MRSLNVVNWPRQQGVEACQSMSGGIDFRKVGSFIRDKDNPPSRREALRLMSENPNLVKRPLFVLGRHVLQGFDEAAVRKLLA